MYVSARIISLLDPICFGFIQNSVSLIHSGWLVATSESCLPTTSTPNHRPWALWLVTPTHLPNHTSTWWSSTFRLYSCQAPNTNHRILLLIGLPTKSQPARNQLAPTSDLIRRPAGRTMKREGWQQGTVRINRRSKLLRVAAAAAANCDDDETVVGGAAMEHGKAPAKPTNVSKNTGKCRRPRCASCHHHPVSKARDKTKGAHKLHAGDVALNHRLVSWRVVDGGAGSSGIPADYKGTSASSLLAYLAGSGSSWHEDDEDDGGSPETAPLVNDLYDIIVGRRAIDPALATDIAVGDTDTIEEQEKDSNDVEEDGDEAEEDMGFCMVGVTIAVEFSDGEEDWIVVEEIV